VSAAIIGLGFVEIENVTRTNPKVSWYLSEIRVKLSDRKEYQLRPFSFQKIVYCIVCVDVLEPEKVLTLRV